MVDLFSKKLILNGITYKLHNSVKDNTIEAVNKWLNTPVGFLGVFKALSGRTNETKREVRKVFNGIIKAKNSPENKGKSEVIVKLNDRNILLKPLLYKA